MKVRRSRDEVVDEHVLIIAIDQVSYTVWVVGVWLEAVEMDYTADPDRCRLLGQALYQDAVIRVI